MKCQQIQATLIDSNFELSKFSIFRSEITSLFFHHIIKILRVIHSRFFEMYNITSKNCVSVGIRLCGIQQAFLFTTFVLSVRLFARGKYFLNPWFVNQSLFRWRMQKTRFSREKKLLLAFLEYIQIHVC